MNRFKTAIYALGLMATTCSLQSCLDDDDNSIMNLQRPTALVTVCPMLGTHFILQLNDSTSLTPSNMSVSPFGDKEVRALVNYTEDGIRDGVQYVHVNWMDSIRTKMPVPSLGDDNDEQYGNDPIEIVRDWVTIAEDGYLTLRIRTLWGMANHTHYINLLTGVNPDNPYELELRHNANGDVNGMLGDALIAFNLRELAQGDDDKVKITLKWKSFGGERSTEFDLRVPSRPYDEDIEAAAYNQYVK